MIGVNYGRVGFLTAIAADELEAALARVFAGDYRAVELADARGDGRRPDARRGQRRGRRRRHARPHDRARVRRSAARSSASQPCDGLICATPDGLDRVQPLERRPGARVGHRRDGADVRRPARARTSGRSSSPRGPEVDDHEPDARTSRRPCSSTASRSARSPGARARACGSADEREPARHAARGDVLPPLRRHLRPIGRPTGAPPYDDGVLRRLRISNLVLIREAELELDAGLNAITGETGAGKTILTNAIGLLLGARGDAALIGAAGDEAYVEAEFDRRRRRDARRARRAAARRRGGARAGAPDLRRRAHARVRVGSQRRARGRRRGGRGR